MSEDVIFTPLQFRNLTVKNRIFRSNISGKFDNEDGSLTQTRINWECKFAAGGVGAIISSYVPVLMEGRIIAGYATIHRDDFIPLWERLGAAVHRFDCKYIMQLSHSGRQMDIPGVHNSHRPALSSTSRTDFSAAPPARPRSITSWMRSPPARGARARPGSTAWSSTPPTATCSRSSSPPASTIAATNTADRCRTARVSYSR
jgi:2,4-dienoyl-CoA reductase-like NADH-dependent reductase (Old Yellow Enzyme family)